MKRSLNCDKRRLFNNLILTFHSFTFLNLQTFPTLHLRLNKPATKKKVQWTTNTVDNEHMNKKKSKCCCIYKKPRNFGESSSESEDECENCYGHVEMKKSNQEHQHHSHSNEDESKDPDPHDKVPGECSH